MNHFPQAAGSVPFPDEMAHLEETNRILEEAFREAEEYVSRMDKEYKDAKHYMADYRGELDPHEMFQNELLLKQTDRTGLIAVNIRDRLSRLKDSPYFARIDFQGRDSKCPDSFYIGRFSFRAKDEMLIYDWRAPVSGMFYDYQTGPAGYDAPMGRINGILTRKRQFHIKNGVMEYALESSDPVQDDILLKELSHTSDEKMKSIIATLQREQNRMIRNEKAETLIIQGVAGSGKTSVALHRIAYLLYRFQDKLSSQNVTILSPNKVFGDYIGGVIPELGEEPIYELSFSQIAEHVLDGVIRFEQDRDPLEEADVSWAERVRFKSTLEFAGLLNRYISNMPDRIFMPTDYTFRGFTAKAGWIRDRFLAYRAYSVKRRLSMTAEDIRHRFENENIWQEELPKLRSILKSLHAMLRFQNTLSLYKDFYQFLDAPRMLALPSARTLEWADVFPFIYLYAAFEGIDDDSRKDMNITKHLVIDEMQDYTPVQYAVINLLFPCPKTILGDFGQFLNPNHLHTLEDMRRLYPEAEFAELNKSYRSSYEIITFAKRLLNNPSLEAVERHGEPPALIACEDAEDELLQLKQAIQAFREGNSTSLGIILKTDQAAGEWFRSLSEEQGITLLKPESTRFTEGVTVTSVRMAKGLEFDEVIIPRADILHYSTEYDRSLLYIACTRALHKLTLIYTGEPSPLLE